MATKSLTPAAQAVLSAMHRSFDHEPTRRAIAAEILLALADHLVPKRPEPTWGTDADHASWFAREDVRDDLLAIAAELDGTTRDPLEPNDLSCLSEEEFLALAPQGFHGV